MSRAVEKPGGEETAPTPTQTQTPPAAYPPGPRRTGDATLRSLEMVPTRPWARRVILTLLALLAIAACCLIFVPWQQSVVGNGRVIVYDAMSRPQNVEALIPGRLESWDVQEGDTVRKGQVLGRIVDIDSKFLDRDQTARIEDQRAALRTRLAEAEKRAGRLESQIAFLTEARDAAIRNADIRVRQSEKRQKIARQAQAATEQSFKVVDEVVRETAQERVAQARDRLEQAKQAVRQAEIAFETSRINRARVRDLFLKELRSGRDDELAEQELISREADLASKRYAVGVAQRDITVAQQEQKRASLDRERARTEVIRAQESVDIALRDIQGARLDQSKIVADTAAQINVAEANLQSVRETVQSIRESLSKLDIDRANLKNRVEQQVVRAPRDGRVVRLSRVGAGETVKSGDVLAVLMPETADQAVEITLQGFDTPLVSVNRPVRIQFNGWPALQISGFPQAAVGTFAGRVSVIDAIDDGTGRYRVIVKPDAKAVQSNGDQPWPSNALLRPGTEAVGWVMLDTVPLWWELWRRFNAFPPSVSQDPSKPYDDGKSDKGGDEAKDAKSTLKDGTIKLPKW